jgi:hypothetical protein
LLGIIFNLGPVLLASRAILVEGCAEEQFELCPLPIVAIFT